MIRFRPISHFLDPSSKEGGCSSGEIARNPGENIYIYIYIERKGRKKMLVGKAGSLVRAKQSIRNTSQFRRYIAGCNGLPGHARHANLGRLLNYTLLSRFSEYSLCGEGEGGRETREW